MPEIGDYCFIHSAININNDLVTDNKNRYGFIIYLRKLLSNHNSFYVFILLAIFIFTITLSINFFPPFKISFNFTSDLLKVYSGFLLIFFGSAYLGQFASELRSKVVKIVSTLWISGALMVVSMILVALSYWGSVAGVGHIVRLGDISYKIGSWKGSKMLNIALSEPLLASNLTRDLDAVASSVESVPEIGLFGEGENDIGFFQRRSPCDWPCFSTLTASKVASIKIDVIPTTERLFAKITGVIGSPYSEKQYFRPRYVYGETNNSLVPKIYSSVMDIVESDVVDDNSLETELLPGEIWKVASKNELCDWSNLAKNTETELSKEKTNSGVRALIKSRTKKFIESRCPEDAYLIGAAYLRLGLPNQAETYLEQAESLATAFASHVAKKIAIQLLQQGEFERSKEKWESYLVSEPNDVDAISYFGISIWRGAQRIAHTAPERQFSREHYSKDIEIVENLLLPLRHDNESIFTLAQMYSAIGEFDKSKTFHKRAIQRSKSEKQLRRFLIGYGMSLVHSGEHDAAKTAFLRAVDHLKSKNGADIPSDSVLLRLGNFEFAMQISDSFFSSLDAAVGWYRCALTELRNRALEPSDTLDRTESIIQELEKLAVAISQFEVSTQLHAREVRSSVLDTQAFALNSMGRFSEAEEKAKLALKLTESGDHLFEDGNIKLNFAEALFGQGMNKTDSEIRIIEKMIQSAISYAPHNGNIHQRGSRLLELLKSKQGN